MASLCPHSPSSYIRICEYISTLEHFVELETHESQDAVTVWEVTWHYELARNFFGFNKNTKAARLRYKSL